MSKFNASLFIDSVFAKFSDWLPHGWSWRRSPLGPLQTLATVISMVAYGKKGYRAALQDVFENLGPAFSWIAGVPSPAALSQARRKLTEKMVRDLFGRLRQEAVHVQSRAQLRYRDFRRLVAADGTKVPLVSTPQLKQAFGCPAGEHLAPQAQVTVLWDLGGNVPVDWRMGPYAESENDHLDDMLRNLEGGDLLLADRLFPSRRLCAECHRRGIHYLFRVKTAASRCLKEVTQFLDSEKDDDVVALREYPHIRVRLTRARRNDGEDLVFLSSLTDQARHSIEAIAQLYQRRWGIETAYREGKDWLGLGQLPGHGKEQVRQEVAALMIFWLLQGEMEGQAREVYAEEIAQAPGVDPTWTPAEGIAEIPVRFNRKLAAQMVAGILAKAAINLEDAVVLWRHDLTNLWRNRARRRPGRSYRRTSERPHDLKKRDALARKKAKAGREKSGHLIA